MTVLILCLNIFAQILSNIQGDLQMFLISIIIKVHYEKEHIAGHLIILTPEHSPLHGNE